MLGPQRCPATCVSIRSVLELRPSRQEFPDMLEALLPYKDQIIKLGFKSSGGGGAQRGDGQTRGPLRPWPEDHRPMTAGAPVKRR